MHLTVHFENSTAKILRTQRLLSAMSPAFPLAPGRPSLGKASSVALARFLTPPVIGRPTKFLQQDKHQLKFDL